MKFTIKEISQTRKEIRISLSSLSFNGTSYYVFGDNGGNFDQTSMNLEGIPPQVSKYYSVGPNPAHIRLIVAYLKDNLGVPAGFKDTNLIATVGQNAISIPIVNIVVDDINLFTLSSETEPTILVKLYNALPDGVSLLDSVSIEKTIIDSQIQDIYYISAGEEPAVVRSLAYDHEMKEEIGSSQLQKNELENLNQITSSLNHQSTEIISQIGSASNINFKTDFNKYENHIHFGSAVSKLENFDYKVGKIENHLLKISQSLATSSNNVVNQLRVDEFKEIQKIKSEFTPYEQALYYKSDTLNLNYDNSVPGIGANYISPKPLNMTNVKSHTNNQGFGVVYHASGSASSSRIRLFQDKYNVEDKPFYNYSGSFYLSFLIKGDESINNNIKWDNQQEAHIPKLPYDTLYTSSIKSPNVKSGSWVRHIYQASSSFWTPHSNNPIVGYVGSINDFSKNSSQVDIITTFNKTGSFPIKVGGRYTNLATHLTSSGVPFSGSISPAGELFHIYVDMPNDGNGNAVTSSYLTDIKITKFNPLSTLPFAEVYSTSSAEYINWYDKQHASASLYDDENPHSLMKTLPTFLQYDNDVNNKVFRNFVNMIGEHFDITKNYIDNFENIFKTQYGEAGNIPENLLPILAESKDWKFQLPFGNNEEASLLEFMGSTLSNVNINSHVKNNIFRNIINSIKYMYETKGTENSIRALLNSYGFPPDILKIKEHGASTDKSENDVVNNNIENIHGGLKGQTGSFSFTQKQDKLVTYNIDTIHRPIHAEWARDSVDSKVIEFVFKPVRGTNEQIILKSSGSANRTQWEIALQPSASSDTKARLQFRINNTKDASGGIHNYINRVSMSTDYHNIKNQNFWNVMLQRTSGPSSSYGSSAGVLSNDLLTSASYVLYLGEQKSDSLRVFTTASMEYGGNTYSHSAANFIGTGSRNKAHGGNLVIGPTMTGSVAEFRAWKYPLSASTFKQHILDKRSSVGNTITSSRENLIYHFKLNENHRSGSMSTTPKIVDSNPSNVKDYSITINTDQLGHSDLYDENVFDRIQFNVGVGGSFSVSENNILIDPEKRLFNNLNPHGPSFHSPYHPLINKRKASNILELTRSPQDVINDFILNQLGNFDFNDLFADPKDIMKADYNDLIDFTEKFFDYYNISLNVNKYIEAQANIFNKGLIDSLKRLVPARAVFGKVGVELKPTFLDRQKIQSATLSKELLNYEGEVKIQDWDRNRFNYLTIGSTYADPPTGKYPLLPLYEKYETSVAMSSHTGSLVGQFTEYEPLYSYNDTSLPVSSHSGSNSFTFTQSEPLYKTNDITLFNVSDGFINSNKDTNYLNYTSEEYQTKDFTFNIASSTGSIAFDFAKLESWDTTYRNTIGLASATGSMAFDFSKLEPLYQTKDFTFNVASSTGSIGFDFTKLEPLYKNHEAVFGIASATGSITFDFTKLESWNTTYPTTFGVASATGSLSFKFTELEPLYENKKLQLFNFDNDFVYHKDSGSMFRFENELYQSKLYHLAVASHTGSVLNLTEEYIPTKNGNIAIASETGSILNYTSEYIENKNLDLPISSHTGSVLNLSEELYQNREGNIAVASETGSVLNLQEEYIKTHNFHVPVASHTGSVLNLSEELYENKNLHLPIASHTGSMLNLTKEYVATKNANIPIASETGSVLNLTQEYISTKNSEIPIASHTGSMLNLTNEYVATKNSHIVISSHTGSKVGLTSDNIFSKNGNLTDWGVKDGNSKTGSILIDTSVYNYNELNFDTKVNTVSGSERTGSGLSFNNSVLKYNNVHFGVASSTGSKPGVSGSLFLPKDAQLYFEGNKTFYEHTQKSYKSDRNRSDLSTNWGRGPSDIKYIHVGNMGTDGDYNTYHYENRYIFYSIGDVESISGSNPSISSSFETDYAGTTIGGKHTSSKDLSNQTFIKLNEFLGTRPLGTTVEFKPSSSLIGKGGQFLDEVLVYPANHIYVVGSSRDGLERLIYKGTQNVGGDVLESNSFTDLDESAFYHVLTTGGQSVIVQ